MARVKKKHQSGQVTAYLSQKQAMRRLQLSLPIFRRLCILKGIYPAEPRNRKKVGKGNSQHRIYYNTKDISFLSREPLIAKFRQLRIYQLKLKKAKNKNDKDKEFRVRINKPTYTLHEIVKERYPTRQSALKDLSDSLNLLFLFSRLPRLTQFHPSLIAMSRRLCIEFLNLIVATQAVRKAFISIKGFYIQVELDGIQVVWIIPHSSVSHTPSDVDYRILATCLEFDATLLGSLLSNLYRLNNLVYPPKVSVRIDPDPTGYYFGQNENHFEFISSLCYPIKRTDVVSEDEVEKFNELQAIDEQVSVAINKQLEVQKIQNLFKNKRFFLNREVPREVLCLIIRSCGGECSWDKTVGPGSTFLVDDSSINYHVVDRPMSDMELTRYYVQPQWVFDCLNAVRLLPTQDYLPGCSLPPHLSPFTSTEESTNATILQRGGLTGVVPGFGAGAAVYRPPEADYLAGLVSLAELRGTAVQVQAEGTEDQIHELGDETYMHTGDDRSHNSDEDNNHVQVDSVKRKNKNTKLKKITKGKTPIITEGKTESKSVQLNRQHAEQNAERKLRELMIPKKHKNVYKKMVHSIQRKEKEVRQLAEKRRIIDMQK